MSFLLVPWLMYRHYGDRRILERQYDRLKAWVLYLGRQTRGHILSYSYYGDWASPIDQGIAGSMGSSAVSAVTPGPLVSTAYYFYGAKLLAGIADTLGMKEDADAFSALAADIREAFNDRFLDRAACQYAAGSQASNTLPVYFGIVPPQCLDRVVGHIAKDVLDHGCHVTTGNLCAKYILEVLADHGYLDLAWRLVTQTTYPSWGYMLENGATTIWERWEYITSGEQCGMASHNHPMYGSVSAWFYRYLAGIRVDEPGWAAFTVRPSLPAGLAWARARLETVRGPLAAGWEILPDGTLAAELTVPFGARATLCLPRNAASRRYENAREGGADLLSGPLPDGFLSAQTEEDQFVFRLGSGEYRIILS